MPFLISIIPGVGVSCAIVLLVLCLNQWIIFRKKAYRRSRSIALFCFFSALFALEHGLVQSRQFSENFLSYYLFISTSGLCLALIFYVKSLSYFIAVPTRLYQLCIYGASGLVAMTFVAFLIFLFTGKNLFFDQESHFFSSNYFVMSYVEILGTPKLYINFIMAASSLLTAFTAAVLWFVVYRSSQDFFFLVGLSISILASVVENALLPFTFEYFVPVIFWSTLFEAFRMHNLSHHEYLNENYSLKHNGAPSECEKYQNSNLSEERITALANKIKKLLDEEKVFTNPNLSSDDLARQIGVPTYQLSQVINIGLNISFFELLSQYRIAHVRKLLKSEEHEASTIINLAYDSGFNSKSSFNTAFKKYTGMTPSAFRKAEAFPRS